MRIHKQFFKNIALLTLLSTGFAAGSIAQDTATINNPETKAPVILTTSPGGGEMNIELGSAIEITFSMDMYEKSINGSTLLLHAAYQDTMHNNDYSEVMLDDQITDQSAIKNSKNSWQQTMGAVGGTISYSDKVAVFTPDQELSEGTMYTFTVTSGVKSSDYVALENDQTWNFMTIGTSDSNHFEKQNERYRYGMGKTEERSKYPASTNETKIIDLGKAGDYVILAKKYINNESGSNITGHIGEGSLANKTKRVKVIGQSTTGDNLEKQSSKTDTASGDVTKALQDMMSAYADAALQYGNDSTTHTDENFHSTVLTPGVHEWNNSLLIKSDVTLSGRADDVWLFKTGKNLTVNENTVFRLTNGALAENVFWYVEGEVMIGENASFEGIILSMDEITLDKGAKMNGRMFSQLSITLDDNTVTEPREMAGQTTSKNK